MYGENIYISVSKCCLAACKAARIRNYSCKMSKKTYKQRQIISIYALMKYLKSNYRGVIGILELMPELLKVLGLKQIPHFTTIQKFVQRFGKINKLISIQKPIDIVAIDASGFSSDYASKYYADRIKGKSLVKNYVKDSICIDTKSQIIISSITSIGPRNDNPDFIPLLAGLRPAIVVADKGYDCENNHKFVNMLNSVSMIPVKNNVRRGKYRHKMQKRFDERIYHQRSKVETVFSVMKRKFGGTIYSRTKKMQVLEVSWINFVYNLHRTVQSKLCTLWMISTEPVYRMLYKEAPQIHPG